MVGKKLLQLLLDMGAGGEEHVQRPTAGEIAVPLKSMAGKDAFRILLRHTDIGRRAGCVKGPPACEDEGICDILLPGGSMAQGNGQGNLRSHPGRNAQQLQHPAVTGDFLSRGRRSALGYGAEAVFRIIFLHIADFRILLVKGRPGQYAYP